MASDRVLLDREERHEKRALTLRVLGGIFFIEALIVCEWIWMGLRLGSALWFWSTIGFVALGVICFGAAEREHRKAIEVVRELITESPVAVSEPQPRRAA